MSLENIYYVGQTVAVVVIVATLFAILWQAHQTNRIARADMTLNMWMQVGQMHYSLIDSAEKADFLHRSLFGADPLTEAEKVRIANILGMVLGTFEAAFNLRVRNLVETTAYDRIHANTRWYLQGSRSWKWWRLRRNEGFDAGFRDIIDTMVKEIESTEHAKQQTQEQRA